MKNIVYFFERFQRRTLLIAVAVVLVVLNLGRWGNDAYTARQDELESKLALLEQYQGVTSKVEDFDERLADLVKVKEQVGGYFFTGENDEKLSSAMQLRIQALVVKAGMQAESIRSTIQKIEGKKGKDRLGDALGEVLIKARLAGSLTAFMDFMTELYRGKEFFQIESVSLKPYRNRGLKIFLELKGYYVLSGSGGNSEELEI